MSLSFRTLTLLQLAVCICNCFSQCKSLRDLANNILIQLILLKNLMQALSLFYCLITRLHETIRPCGDVCDLRSWLAVYGTVPASKLRRLCWQVLDRSA